MSDFDFVETPDGPELSNDFAGVADYADTPSPRPTPLSSAILAVASSEDSPVGTVTAFQEESLATARELIAKGQEYNTRLQIAGKRQQRQLKAINKLRAEKPDRTVSPETQRVLDDNYNGVLAQNAEDEAKTSAETETIRRVMDDLSQGNAVEARLSYDLLTRGNAEKIVSDEMTKQLLVAQYLEKLQAESEDESYAGKAWNFITSAIPLNLSFSREGVVEGAETKWYDFFMPGENIQKQGVSFYEKYRTPTDLAAALNGGELDQSIRSNATTWGGFDPDSASELTRQLAYIDKSDREWANIWGVADPILSADVLLLAPWKLGTGIAGSLTRMGSRSGARTIVADAFKTVVDDATDKAVAKSGLGEKEITSHFETTAMNPAASTPNSVPMAADLSTHLQAAENVMARLPTDLQIARATTPEEIMTAYQASLKAEEARLGRSIKDHSFRYEDVRTGQKYVYDPKIGIPEQGNVVHYVEYTIGKKSGDGFASIKSAQAEATKRGLVGTDFYFDAVTNEVKTLDPEFAIRGYHGTADTFDKFDTAFGGKLTDANSAKMAIFATNNPDVAWTYAVQSARDKGRSLKEMDDLSYNAKLASAKIADRQAILGSEWGVFNPRVQTATSFEKLARETALFRGSPDVIERGLNELRSLRDARREAETAYANFIEETTVSGQNIRPVAIRMRNPYIHDYANEFSNGFDEKRYSEIIERAKREGHDGVILRNTNDAMGPHPDRNHYFDADADGFTTAKDPGNTFENHNIYAVFNAEDIVAPWDAVSVKKDVSGQYFIKNRVNVKEEGFYTAPLNTPENNFLSGLRSDARRIDRSAQQRAVAAGQNAENLTAEVNKAIKESLKGIGKTDKRWLDEVIRKGQNESKWLSEKEFDAVFERAAGYPPSEKVANAYKSYRLFNDIEYLRRNDLMYKEDVVRGFETVTFNMGIGDITFNGTARVGADATVPAERVFNVSDGVHVNVPGNVLTKDELDRLIGDDYLLVKSKDVVTLPDGVVVRNFLVRRGHLERRPLERMQLAYSEGGHRAYTGKHFAKQATTGVQPDTGQKFLKNPNVFRTSNNPNKLRRWAATMNKAIDDVNDGILDPTHYDDLFDVGDLHFPSGEDFLTSVERGEIDLKNPIEVVYDREMPTAYTDTREDVARFVDTEESPATGYYRTTGRLYSSRKGEHLLDESGEFAETVDPWETMNTAMANISRMSSMSNYKTSTLERFTRTYGKHLKLRQIDEATPQEMLLAEVKDGLDPSLVQRIKAEQAGITRILRFETKLEKGFRMANRQLASAILGDAEEGLRVGGYNFVHWLENNNPVAALRSFAFDIKLGLFNVGQLFLQTSTIAASIAISPKGGLKAMGSMIPLYAFHNMKGNEAVLDVLAKRSWKTGGFDSEGEMKEFMRFVNRTGWMNVGNTHLLINDYGPNRVFGAASMKDAVLEKGRTFFYAAEQFNRSVAARLAWEELKGKGIPVGSAAFRENFVGLADDLTFNMTNESSAAFQHGLLSIPTQFWAYNVRMMDAMMGNRFTTAQKSRLIFSQFALYGAGGVPVVDAIADFMKRNDGDPETTDINSVLGVLDRGAFDAAIHAVTGADIRFGERVGTGAFSTDLVKDIFGWNEFGEKSPAEALGGASWSIGGEAFKTLRDAAYYSYAETGSDQGWVLTKDNILKMAMNISTVSNTTKALIAYNYGMYKSNAGSVQATDLPSADAFFIALGMRPQEVDDAGTMSSYLKNKDEVKKEAAKQLRVWRQEAFSNPDLYEENMRKANAFMKFVPAEARQDILKQVNRTTDESFYGSVARKFEQEKMKEEALGER